MDSSDILRKKQAQTVYGFYKAAVFNSSGVINTIAFSSPTPVFVLAIPLNHGMIVGDKIAFASLGSGFVWSTAIALNTIYYVIGIGATEFQFSATPGGSAITYTGTITVYPTIYGPRSCITNSLACTSLTACVTTFPSYEERQKFITGSQVCNSCSKTGCGCT
jgi:hypothetical protein